MFKFDGPVDFFLSILLVSSIAYLLWGIFLFVKPILRSGK